ncbi:MAG: glycosyltransferase family protein [Candidatus Marinarcus sp.]|uniref:glycosyltransferase family protein n=1 Tax=Candidatus Marinarcus sp. TaxID=3100987 RepID=UPI003AFFDB7F
MESFKIVHCANFSESKNGDVFYAIDRIISNGLIRNNHFVYNFSYREVSKSLNFFRSKKSGAKKMNRALIETVRNIQPHLLLLGHSELIYDTTLELIKNEFPAIKIAMWWVDPFERIEHIKSRIKYLDAFFATTNPSYYKQFFEEKTAFYYLPNLCDDSIERSSSFENEKYKYDLTFIGRNDCARKNFIESLNNFKNINFKLFGNSKDTLILGNDYLELLFNSKMAINYSRYNDISLYSSDRIIQLTAQGVMTLSPKIPDMEILFNDNEIVYFKDFLDLEEKVNYYLEHDKERREIAYNGWKRAHNSYNSTRITKYMIESIFNLLYSDNYEWKEFEIKGIFK